MAKKQVILIIVDGWGIGPKNDSNPIHTQGTPNLDYLKANFLIGGLQASGISVGLPWGEEGNSEVGHLTIGAGKVLYQHYPRITLSIRDGTFKKNPVFTNLFSHLKNTHGALNIAGLLSEGNIHASLEHLIALINLAKTQKIRTNLHLFTDGKDSAPQSVANLLKNLSEATDNSWNIGSISGRHYALDRDSHWDKTALAYNAMIGSGPQESDLGKIVQKTYGQKLNDQYIEPHTVNPEAAIRDGDALFFADFREDSIRQIASAFLDLNFSQFPIQQFKNLQVATMTNYSDQFKAPVAYPPEKVNFPLAKVLADSGKSQIHIAETEKYAHITYFFNGYKETPFPNEYRILLPSRKIASHAEKPEMQAAEITSRVIQSIEEKSFDFILVNFANGDMVAHTGNYQAAKLAIKAVDESIGKIVRSALENNAVMIITSDHGNVENMLNPQTGEATTVHDPNPVPIYIVGNEFIKQKTPTEVEFAEKETAGILSDVAPTILEIMEIPKPPEMTGQSLLKLLR